LPLSKIRQHARLQASFVMPSKRFMNQMIWKSLFEQSSVIELQLHMALQS